MNRPSISVVIPTLKGNPRTLESVPEGVETVVVGDGNRAEARNIGVRRTRGEVLVFCDDDIAFGESFLWDWVNWTDPGTISGLRDFDFGLLLTRFMVVHRTDYQQLGGFDNRLNHMEDTEFCLNALAHGLSLISIPREAVHHEPHKSAGQSRWSRLRNTAYLSLQYPRYASKLWIGQLTSQEPFINSEE